MAHETLSLVEPSLDTIMYRLCKLSQRAQRRTDAILASTEAEAAGTPARRLCDLYNLGDAYEEHLECIRAPILKSALYGAPIDTPNPTHAEFALEYLSDIRDELTGIIQEMAETSAWHAPILDEVRAGRLADGYRDATEALFVVAWVGFVEGKLELFGDE
jgi:hypothetical protein